MYVVHKSLVVPACLGYRVNQGWYICVNKEIHSAYFSISAAAALLFSCALSLSVLMHAVDRGFVIDVVAATTAVPSPLDILFLPSDRSAETDDSPLTSPQLTLSSLGEHLFHGRGRGASLPSHVLPTL